MYSRAFGENGERVPPQYGGTALHRRERRDEERESERLQEEGEDRVKECPRDETEGVAPPPREECATKQETPCTGLRLPLPYGIRLEDLLLLGLAVLLWLDGCEDEYLPLLLLFLLIVH